MEFHPASVNSFKEADRSIQSWRSPINLRSLRRLFHLLGHLERWHQLIAWQHLMESEHKTVHRKSLLLLSCITLYFFLNSLHLFGDLFCRLGKLGAEFDAPFSIQLLGRSSSVSSIQINQNNSYDLVLLETVWVENFVWLRLQIFTLIMMFASLQMRQSLTCCGFWTCVTCLILC